MPFSSGLSPQMKMLPQHQQDAIMADYARSPDASGPPPSINMLNNGVRISGPIFAGDEAASPATVGPLTRAQVFGDTPQQESEAQGALSRAAPALPRHSPPDITEMLKQYMPQDDSQSRYLALAAGLLSPTKTGSFGEQLGNVASAMQIQRAEQEKMRAQYVPLIMQQVAAQQAREEQARYRLEAQQQAQAAQAQAAQQAQAARAEMARLAQQSMNERMAADRASREGIAAEGRSTRELLAGLKADQNVPKTKPGEVWDPTTQTIKVIPGSELERVQKGAHAKDFGVMQSTISSMDTSIGKLDEILSDKNKDAFNGNFGGYNALATQYTPGSITDMRKLLTGFKADLAKTGLDMIRAGGSIGAMTEKEWPIVESMVAKIDPTLGEEAARAEFGKVKAYMARIRDNASNLYNVEWKDSPHYKAPGKADTPPPDKSAVTLAPTAGWSIKPK